MEHGTTRRGGWPLSATLTVPGLRLAGGAATLPGGMEWQSEALRLRVAPPWLDRLRVEMLGPQRLRLGATEVPFAADRLETILPLEPGVLPREGSFEAERLRLGTPSGAAEMRWARMIGFRHAIEIGAWGPDQEETVMFARFRSRREQAV